MNKMNLDVLCCPLCQADLNEDNNLLICVECGKEYKYKYKIPVLLLDYISL